MRILLYGIGRYTKQIMKNIKKDCEIVCVSDSFAEISNYFGIPFVKKDRINSVKFDYIVLCVGNRKICADLALELESVYKVTANKIIPYILYSESQIYKIKKINPEVRGVVLGNSHAFYGLMEDSFDEKTCNLSCLSQDIFFNKCVFDKVCENDLDIVQNLNYICWDLYDYNSLNSDISLTKGLFDYYSWGGILERHNYEKNKFYDGTLEEQLMKEKNLMFKVNTELMEQIFVSYDDFRIVERIENINNRWGHISTDEPLTTSKFLGGIVKNRYEETIEENKKIIIDFVETVNRLNPDCKIIFTLLPRYITMEETTKLFRNEWKFEFEKFMDMLIHKYGVFYLDYKGTEEISRNNYFYNDINHLNTLGGQCMSQIINEDIVRIVR